MKYIGPSYDMWKLGCLLYEAATDKKLFSQGEIDMLRRMLKQEGRKNGLTRVPSFSDEHYLLDLMVTLLGNVPREVCPQAVQINSQRVHVYSRSAWGCSGWLTLYA